MLTTDEKIFQMQKIVRGAFNIDLDKIRQRTRHKDDMKMRYATIYFANQRGLIRERMDMYFIFNRTKTALYDATTHHNDMMKNKDVEYIALYNMLEREGRILDAKQSEVVLMLPTDRYAAPNVSLDNWLQKAIDCYDRFFVSVTPVKQWGVFLNENIDRLRELYKEQMFPYNAVLKIVQEKYA